MSGDDAQRIHGYWVIERLDGTDVPDIIALDSHFESIHTIWADLDLPGSYRVRKVVLTVESAAKDE